MTASGLTGLCINRLFAVSYNTSIGKHKRQTTLSVDMPLMLQKPAEAEGSQLDVPGAFWTWGSAEDKAENEGKLF